MNNSRAPNGTTSPLITWQRVNAPVKLIENFQDNKIIYMHYSFQRDGKPLSRDRIRVVEGSLTVKNLHQSDYGEYECVASNEVATLVASTKIIVEGTRPHAPYNITASCAVFSVTLSWLPGYSGRPFFACTFLLNAYCNNK